MSGGQVATVAWGDPNSRASLYGTTLKTDASGEVHLANRLMPSGTILQEWYSFTSYQAVRSAPALPLLHQGKTYRIEPTLTASPAESVNFDVQYFDRFGSLLRTEVLYPPEYSFAYPRQCHHYTIRLLNAGCDELSFTSFSLREVDDRGQQ